MQIKMMVARWEEIESLGEKGEETKKYKLAVKKNSQEGVKHSMGNIVNDIVITMYGVRCILDLPEGSLCDVNV